MVILMAIYLNLFRMSQTDIRYTSIVNKYVMEKSLWYE